MEIIKEINKTLNDIDFDCKYIIVNKNEFCDIPRIDDYGYIVKDGDEWWDILFKNETKAFVELRWKQKQWCFHSGQNMNDAEKHALKIIPEFKMLVDTNKITKKYIHEYVMELSFLIKNYTDKELGKLLKKQNK